MKPMIKWTTGNTNLISEIKKYLPKYYNTYYEPFIGGGSVLFSIIPQRAVINDINPELMNLYECVKNKPEIVIQMLKHLDETTPNTAEAYNEIRERFNNKIKSSTYDIMSAVLLLWLSNWCIGAYRVNKNGMFNASFNHIVIKNKDKFLENRANDYANIWEIGQYMQEFDVNILNQDFEKTCLSANKDDFVYIDSPHISKKKSDEFDIEDHKRLAELVDTLTDRGVFVMLSNSDVLIVREMYEGYNIIPVDTKKKKEEKTLIITNYEVEYK